MITSHLWFDSWESEPWKIGTRKEWICKIKSLQVFPWVTHANHLQGFRLMDSLGWAQVCHLGDLWGAQSWQQPAMQPLPLPYSHPQEGADCCLHPSSPTFSPLDTTAHMWLICMQLCLIFTVRLQFWVPPNHFPIPGRCGWCQEQYSASELIQSDSNWWWEGPWGWWFGMLALTPKV